MTKLQLGLGAAVVLAGTGGMVIQSHELTQLRDQTVAVESQARLLPQATAQQIDATAAVRRAEADTAARANELTQWRDRAQELRAQIAAANQAVAAKPASRVQGMPVYDARALTQQPKPTAQVPPLYPASMRSLGLPGKALVDFVVAPDGTVQNATVVKASDPAFGDAALEAIQRWQFKPGQKDGAVVATHLQIPIMFTLADDDDDAGPAKSNSKPEAAPWF